MQVRVAKRIGKTVAAHKIRRRMRSGPLTALAVVTGLVLAGCGSGEEESPGAADGNSATVSPAEAGAGDESGGSAGGTLTIASETDMLTMDPQAHRNRWTQSVMSQMYDYLVGLDADFNYVPELAESWSKVDDLTWEFKLRPGVKFWNGDPLTAESVKGTYDRMMDPEMKSPRSSMGFQTDIEEIEVVDDLTIRFHTAYDFGAEDDPSRLGVYSQEIINPEYAEEVGKDVFAKKPMGSGPFIFDEWVPGQRLVMHANADYWGGAPKVDKVIIRPVPESSTRTSELQTGSVDLVYPVDADTVAILGDQVDILSVAGTRQTFLGMNMKEGPFADLEVRKAMNQAIDKQAIVDGLFEGYAEVGNQISFKGQGGYDENYEGIGYDQQAAKAVLSQITEPIKLDTSSAEEVYAAALAEQLRQAGLNVTVNSMETAAFTEHVEGGKSQLFFASLASATGTFSGAFYNRAFACEAREAGVIWTGFCEPELDARIEAATQLPDKESLAKVEQEVALAIMEQAPEVPLWNEDEIWAAGKNVAGFTAAVRFDLGTVSVK